LEYLATKKSKDELTNKIDNIVSTTKVNEEFGRSYMIANMRDIMMKKQAFNEGLQQGSHETKIETARKLLLKNVDIAIISDCTGLSLETIEDLAKKINPKEN